ncbi:MAG: hypothetical protein HKP41_00970 [Desulfobacterales bacterium]|nr:hypothetical protein [Desulfobacterales bacterium]
MSPLYARYNGAMLGYFLSGAMAQYARRHYPVLQQRMNQFLEELGALPLLPPTPIDYAAQGRLIEEVLFMVRMQSEKVADFALLTCLAFQHVIQRGIDDKVATQSRELALDWMATYKIPSEALDKFAATVVPEKDGWISADQLHSAGLVFIRDLLKPLRTARNTAFVAMPFAQPFDSYFVKFYTPLLKDLNYTTIRAWGGLSHENYQEIVHTLIRKSGIVLADLTSTNLNVIHEVGLAEGMGKTVFLIAAKDETIPPSNLGDLAIVTYDRSSEGWEERETLECSTVLALAKAGAELESSR